METIKKHILIESDIIRIPELKHYIGKHMEIILIEEDIDASKDRYTDFFNLAGKIDLDEEEINRLREISKL